MPKTPDVDETHTTIIEPDGSITPVGSTQDIPQASPDGSRRYIRHTTMHRTLDGHLINPDRPRARRCQVCQRSPFHTTYECQQCRREACTQCTRPLPTDEPAHLCIDCIQHAQRASRWRYFFSIR